MSRRLSMIAIVVPDYDDAISHFVDDLGFTLVEDTDQGNGKRWVRVAFGAGSGAGSAIVLARAVNDCQSGAIGNQTGGRVGFFLQTDDFARDHAAMVARGVVFEEPPRHEPYGTVAVFRDKYDNRWDLIEPA